MAHGTGRGRRLGARVSPRPRLRTRVTVGSTGSRSPPQGRSGSAVLSAQSSARPTATVQTQLRAYAAQVRAGSWRWEHSRPDDPDPPSNRRLRAVDEPRNSTVRQPREPPWRHARALPAAGRWVGHDRSESSRQPERTYSHAGCSFFGRARDGRRTAVIRHHQHSHQHAPPGQETFAQLRVIGVHWTACLAVRDDSWSSARAAARGEDRRAAGASPTRPVRQSPSPRETTTRSDDLAAKRNDCWSGSRTPPPRAASFVADASHEPPHSADRIRTGLGGRPRSCQEGAPWRTSRDVAVGQVRAAREGHRTAPVASEVRTRGGLRRRHDQRTCRAMLTEMTTAIHVPGLSVRNLVLRGRQSTETPTSCPGVRNMA